MCYKENCSIETKNLELKNKIKRATVKKNHNNYEEKETIHRSQGMTLDQVDLVLPQYSLFGDNMLYVAVSRCRDLSNLKLNRKLNINDIKTNQYVVNYMKSLM